MIKAPLHTRGFSLVETVLVLAIMSILDPASDVVPCHAPIDHSYHLRQSDGRFAGHGPPKLNLKKCLYPCRHQVAGSRRYSSYCLLELTRQDDGSFGAWSALSPGATWGGGVVFESGQANDTFTATSLTLPLPLPTTFPLPFQGQPILTSTTTYQCYQPTGH